MLRFEQQIQQYVHLHLLEEHKMHYALSLVVAFAVVSVFTEAVLDPTDVKFVMFGSLSEFSFVRVTMFACAVATD